MELILRGVKLSAQLFLALAKLEFLVLQLADMLV